MESDSRSRPLTPLELKIMKVLWDAGPATVQAVQAKLPGEPRLAYTTVQTMLNVLHRKNKVTRTLKGRAYEYAPLVSREMAARTTLRDVMTRFFGGSAENLVMSLVASRDLKPAKLAKLKRLVEQANSAAKEKHGNTEPLGVYLPAECFLAGLPCDSSDGVRGALLAECCGAVSACTVGDGSRSRHSPASHDLAGVMEARLPGGCCREGDAARPGGPAASG